MRRIGHIHSIWVLAMVWFFTGPLIVRATPAPLDSTEIDALIRKSESLIRNNPDSALYYVELALGEARQIENASLEADALQSISTLYQFSGQLDKGIEFLEEAIRINKNIGNHLRLAYSQLDLANLYKAKGDYPSALRTYHMVKSYFESNIDSAGLSLTYSRLGNIYANLEHYHKALEFHQKSLHLNELRGFELGISVNWNNLAAVYQHLDRSDSALPYLEKTLALKEQVKDKRGILSANMNLGVVHTNLGNLGQAEEYLRHVLRGLKEYPMPQVKADCYTNLCYLYIKKGDPSQAIEYGERAHSLLRDGGFPHSRMFAYQKLSHAYRDNGDYEQALNYLRDYNSLRDSLLPSDLPLMLVESEAELAAEKQATEIELLRSQDALNQLELDVQERQLWWIGALLGLMAVIAIVLYSRYRLKLKTNRQLKELDEVKSRFFANLSHEFRTPLTLIIGPLEEMIEQAKEARDEEALQRVLRNANHLLNLNEQLLDLARIESGVLQVDPVRGRVISFVGGIAESFRVLAERKGLDFGVSLEGDGLEVGFDADKLEKVLNNLLSNAVKYTGTGGKVEVIAKAGSQLDLEVSDSGQGIPPDELERIFDRYFRLEHHLEKGVKGVGIGLSLSRELVELMGGRIQVDSEIGEGSRFRIELPFLEGGVSANESKSLRSGLVIQREKDIDLASPGTVDPEDGELPQLLIVDDHEDIRAFICQQFEGSYAIREAANGQQALESALEEPPDLVISDLMMPVMDGIDLCKALKSDVRTSHVPVIMLTALATVESRIEGLETGADDYLNKPFNAQELKVRVRNLVERHRRLQEHFAARLKEGEEEKEVLPSSEQVFYSRVESFILAHLDSSDLTVEGLSDELALSRVQLFRKVKAITGRSPSQLIREIRLRKAAEILKMKTGNVSEAMFAAGFDNPSYFAKVFREQYGCTPSKYA